MLPIAVALSGRALGHQLRWADEFLAKNQDSIENAVVVLRGWVIDIRNAQKLAVTNFKKEPTTASDLCKALDAYGDEFPTELKYQVLELKLSDYVHKGLVERYMLAIVAWESEGCGREKHAKFSPLKPSLLDIEGTMAEKGSGV